MPETLTKPARAPHGSINWELVKTLYLQGLDAHDITRETGYNRETLNVGLCKRGITKLPRNLKPTPDTESLSRLTRSKLAAAADKLADCLQDPPKSLERQVLYADVLQKSAKTAALVHGWGEGGALAVIVAGDLTGRPDQEPIEAQVVSEVVSEEQEAS